MCDYLFLFVIKTPQHGKSKSTPGRVSTHEHGLNRKPRVGASDEEVLRGVDGRQPLEEIGVLGLHVGYPPIVAIMYDMYVQYGFVGTPTHHKISYAVIRDFTRAVAMHVHVQGVSLSSTKEFSYNPK